MEDKYMYFFGEIENGNLSFVKKAIESGEHNINEYENGRTPLMTVVSAMGSKRTQGLQDVFDYLLSQNPDLELERANALPKSGKGYTVLGQAVQYQNLHVVKQLIDAGACPQAGEIKVIFNGVVQNGEPAYNYHVGTQEEGDFVYCDAITAANDIYNKLKNDDDSCLDKLEIARTILETVDPKAFTPNLIDTLKSMGDEDVLNSSFPNRAKKIGDGWF